MQRSAVIKKKPLLSLHEMKDLKQRVEELHISILKSQENMTKWGNMINLLWYIKQLTNILYFFMYWDLS